jgi:hypothetical protein
MPRSRVRHKPRRKIFLTFASFQWFYGLPKKDLRIIPLYRLMPQGEREKHEKDSLTHPLTTPEIPCPSTDH